MWPVFQTRCRQKSFEIKHVVSKFILGDRQFSDKEKGRNVNKINTKNVCPSGSIAPSSVLMFKRTRSISQNFGHRRHRSLKRLNINITKLPNNLWLLGRKKSPGKVRGHLLSPLIQP